MQSLFYVYVYLPTTCALFLINQVRDEYRTDFDGGRGGYGMIVKQKLEIPETFGQKNVSNDKNNHHHKTLLLDKEATKE